MELLLNILGLLLSFLPIEKIMGWGIFVFAKAVFGIIHQLIWAVAVLVRRDEHTADTEEWIERTIYGHTEDDDEELEAASEGQDEEREESASGAGRAWWEPKPEHLDTLDPATPDPPAVKDFGWMSRGQWPGQDSNRP